MPGALLRTLEAFRPKRMTVSESNEKAYYTLELVKNEVVRPGRLFSLGQCVEIVKNLSGGATADIHEIAGIILKDISLTTRVLQVANSIEYNRSGKRIVTVSQAIMVLGLAPIRSIAFSILLLEQLPNHAQAEHIRNACLMSVMGGSLARMIAEKAKMEDPEQGFITAAFTQLGKILLATFLPEEQREIARMTREEGRTEEEAERTVLGLRIEQFGKQIGEFLNLPGSVTSYMDPFNVSDRDLPMIDRKLLQVTMLSHRVCRAVAMAKTATEMEDALRNLSQFKESSINGLDLVRVFRGVVEEIGKFYAVRPNGEFWAKAQMLCQTDKKGVTITPVAVAAASRSPDLQVFQDGVLTVTEMLAVDEINLGQLLSVIAETLYLGFKARNVVVAVKDPAQGAIVGQAAYGVHAAQLRESFIVRPGIDGALLTGMAVQNGKDIAIDNAQETHILEHLPTWIATTEPTSFLLQPIMQDTTAVGLFYIDGPLLDADSKTPAEVQRELKIIRKELVLALRLTGRL